MKHRIVAFVMAAVPGIKGRRAEVAETRPLQSAPHYFAATVPKQYLVAEDKGFRIKSYPPNIVMVEVTREVDDVFSDEAFRLREQLVDECQKILRKHHADIILSEEYAIAIVSEYQNLDQLIAGKAARIAGFLKSEPIELDEDEIEHTLKYRLKYGKEDMVVVDWDGAMIFEPTGKVDAVVELFQVANLQLLQYRILDSELDYRLRKVEKIMRPESPLPRYTFWNREVSKAFRQVISVRAHSIMDFDSLEREIKLIGDWYSARLFELIARKFRLAEWRASIKEKLDSIEDVYGIVAENFSVTKQHFLEMLQIVLFFVLQIGWFVLILLELYYFTRQIAP